MWQRFTERARRVVFFAQEEAGKRGSNEVGPEHMLLGMLREDDSVAAHVLISMSISLVALADNLLRLTPQGPGRPTADMQLTAEARAAIDLASDEAERLDNNYIGTEHLLLGLLRQDGTIALQALAEAGVELAAVRVYVTALQTTSSLEAARKAAGMGAVAPSGHEAPLEAFTEEALRVVFLAKEEARRLGESYYSTEHILLGLCREASPVTTDVLAWLNLTSGVLRTKIERQVSRGDASSGKEAVATPRAKRIFGLAHEESIRLRDDSVGPEHLLLALIREGEGLAGRVLNQAGVNLVNARAALTAVREGTPIGETTSRSRLEMQVEALRQRIAELPKPQADETLAPASDVDAPSPLFGDLGVASASPGRSQIDVAHDAAAFRKLLAVFLAKDAYGYRSLTDGDQTVFLLSSGTRLKLLVPPAESEDVFEEGHHVRVLEGDYAGYAGWIFKDAFVRTGFDDAAFPPTI